MKVLRFGTKINIIGAVLFVATLVAASVIAGTLIITSDSFTATDVYEHVGTFDFDNATIQHYGQTASYVIIRDGDTYYAKNGETNKIDYSGTVCHTVVNNAIDDLPTTGVVDVRESGEATRKNCGGEIHFSNGAFNITDSIDFSGLRNIKISGEGTSTVINNLATDGSHAIQCLTGTGTRVEICDLLVQGNANSGDGIHLYNIDYPYIHGVTSQYNGENGLFLNAVGTATENQMVTNCHFLFNYNAGLKTDSCHDTLISNTHFEENDIYGLHAIDTYDLHVVNCNLEDGYGDYEVNITEGRGFWLDNCIIEGNIYVDSDVTYSYSYSVTDTYVGKFNVTGHDKGKIDISGASVGESNFYDVLNVKITGSTVSLNVVDAKDVYIANSIVGSIDDLDCEDIFISNSEVDLDDFTVVDTVSLGNCESGSGINLDGSCANLILSNSACNLHNITVTTLFSATNCKLDFHWLDLDKTIITGCEVRMVYPEEGTSSDCAHIESDDSFIMSNCDMYSSSGGSAFYYGTASQRVSFTGNTILYSAADNFIVDGNGHDYARLIFNSNNLRFVPINFSSVDIIKMDGNLLYGGTSDVYIYDCDYTFNANGNVFRNNADLRIHASCDATPVISDGVFGSGCIIVDSTGTAIIHNNQGYVHQSLWPLYNQSAAPDIPNDTEAWWNDPDGPWFYHVCDYEGTQYYTNMSTTY